MMFEPNMENQEVSCDVDDDELSLNHIVDEEDFRSCCGDDEQESVLCWRGQEKILSPEEADFYAQDSVANYLALLDGLTVALENNLHSVVAVTDSELLYNQASPLFSKWFHYLSLLALLFYTKWLLQITNEENGDRIERRSKESLSLSQRNCWEF
ncbi:hypothetical protein HID58_093208 [Brassica napus]|uniref:RNase H type-1 domain-containing protein n=1 Tax=Brassica napus TaxID=3708 RepID=A0ABQ7XBV4_BRANA|nr:hypothetical protein HID58_093208 [Brassica napus]